MQTLHNISQWHDRDPSDVCETQISDFANIGRSFVRHRRPFDRGGLPKKTCLIRSVLHVVQQY